MKFSIIQAVKIPKKIALLTFIMCLFASHFAQSYEVNRAEKKSQITVYNDLAIERVNETITVSLEHLAFAEQKSWPHIVVKDSTNNKALIYQLIDTNNDGVIDSLIFQVNISASRSKQFQFSLNSNSSAEFTDAIVSYSRFVPERIDDYAWENDRVAFRMYGPKARQLVMAGEKGGIISSGVDCWLKRVEYPILNKWYKKYADGTGDYHQDTGEGLDNYHVGSTLGCGGTGSLYKGNLFVSGNFSDYSTSTIGPIRTSFQLDYSPWNTGKAVVKEVKSISLDKGCNLTRYELIFDRDVELVAGLSLDQHSLDITTNQGAGYFSSWRKQQDSELGLAIVAEPKYVNGYQQTKVKGKAGEHLFVQLKSINKRIVYYSGFGWKKNQNFSSLARWNQYLEAFSQKLNKPLRIQYD